MAHLKNLYQKSYKTLLVIGIAVLAMSTITSEDNKYFEITKNIEIFANLYKEINTYYVDELDPSHLMRTGVDAMLHSLDPYTNYISEAEIEGFRITTTGKYGGIGALIRKQGDYVVVTEPYEGFAAQKGGLKAGDLILEIDGKSARGKTTDEVSDVLKGSPGTTVELTIERPELNGNKKMKLALEREKITVPNVPYYGMVDGEIGYLTLTTFTERAGANVGDAVRKLKEENPNLKGVIFDLRGNGGGLLNEAVDVANVFVNAGELVVTTRGKIKDWDRDFKTNNPPVDLNIPLAILIDGGSASASEIVSGVIQDLDRGVLVGQRSFGKGLVQNTRDVGYNSRVKLTTAKYYIPSGRCIQAVSYKDGEPIEISDSLRGKFMTRNGRLVLDGGGVAPDIKIEKDKMSNLTVSLLNKHLIFDYATRYVLQHPALAPAKEFQLQEADYQDFVNFVQSKNHTYLTQSEKALKELEDKARKEKYYDAIKNDIEVMRKRIEEDKKNDFLKFKVQISNELEREIAQRYYFQKGQVEVGLQNDAEVAAAIQILKDGKRYNELLKKQ